MFVLFTYMWLSYLSNIQVKLSIAMLAHTHTPANICTRTHTYTHIHTHTHTRAHRTEFVSSITRELPDTSPSDLLLVQQEMTQDSSNETGCVNITLRVLGTSCKTFLMLC